MTSRGIGGTRMRSAAGLRELLDTYDAYRRARTQYPALPARTVMSAIRAADDGAAYSLAEAVCYVTTGHRWPRGIDERDRCLCVYCGADGDA